ncbi:MAG: penicillin acylase family protein [Actinomycetota bacterium]|nr:penicillin acylase family protein [Actinomycetota bacterium]
MVRIHLQMRRLVIACLATLIGGLGLSGTAGAQDTPPSSPGLFLNILPAGQGTSFSLSTGNPPPHTDDQLDMYRTLPMAGDLSDADLQDYFKSEAFGVAPQDVEREQRPREGVSILRDRFGVPHIFGDTRADAMFGAGYVTAEDRLFMIDVLRHYGRGRLSELLGASEANLEIDRSMYGVAGYSEEELQQQVDRLNQFGDMGEEIIADGFAYIDGINARIQEVLLNPSLMPAEYGALQLVPKEWKPTDLVAVATLIQAIFASGGGGELSNAEFLNRAGARLGRTTARRLFRDLRSAEEPEAPVTTKRAFRYMTPRKVTRRAVAVPDRGSLTSYDPISTTPPSEGGSETSLSAALDPMGHLKDVLAEAGVSFPDGMSNWLAATADRTAAGHPIAVMGPQTGYFSPQILMEIDIHAPGVHARGATFPGISQYVLLGRGPGFAWSATSGGSDLSDVRAERLCEPDGSPATTDSTHYVFRGECVPMTERTDRWVAKPTAAGQAPPTEVEAHVKRTIHGPVIATGTVGGQPVAFTLQRSTFFAELDSAVPFALLNTNQVTSAASFQAAMADLTGSFNWLYVDHQDVAYFHSGRYPVRARGVNPNLPSWGTGQWEWRRFVQASGHPQAINPSKGWIDSWNNKPARAWRAADANWGFGTVHRSEMLSDRLTKRVSNGGLTPSDLVEVMADAATVDLRGQEVLPPVLAAIGSNRKLQPYTRLLRAWVRSGAHRLDRDGDGEYDDQAAVALMDEWWPRLVKAVFDPTLAGLYDVIPLNVDDPNRTGHVGSSFQSGYYGPVEKAVRMALGRPVAKEYSVLKCADGTRAGCRAAVRASLRDAVAALGRDPSTWDADEAGETIRFQPVGLVEVPDIPWQNRPTFQQVVQVED